MVAGSPPVTALPVSRSALLPPYRPATMRKKKNGCAAGGAPRLRPSGGAGRSSRGGRGLARWAEPVDAGVHGSGTVARGVGWAMAVELWQIGDVAASTACIPSPPRSRPTPSVHLSVYSTPLPTRTHIRIPTHHTVPASCSRVCIRPNTIIVNLYPSLTRGCHGWVIDRMDEGHIGLWMSL